MKVWNSRNYPCFAKAQEKREVKPNTREMPKTETLSVQYQARCSHHRDHLIYDAQLPLSVCRERIFVRVPYSVAVYESHES